MTRLQSGCQASSGCVLMGKCVHSRQVKGPAALTVQCSCAWDWRAKLRGPLLSTCPLILGTCHCPVSHGFLCFLML